MAHPWYVSRAFRYPPGGLLGPEFLENVAPGRGLMSFIKRIAALVAGAVITVAAQGLALAQGASPDDVAKFLAGMQPSAGSPLAPLTRNQGWQRHAKWFDSNWDTLEKRQLSKVRAWSERHLK